MQKILMNHYNASSDYGEVYRLFTDVEVNPLIINKPDHNNMMGFEKWLDKHLEHSINDFLVFRTEENDFIGFAYSYEFHPGDGICQFTVAVKSAYQKTGIGGVIALKFLQYLFVCYSLRKVYIHIYGHNVHSIRCVEAFGFQKEGVLQEYRFFNGKYQDICIYSIGRERFEELVKKYSAML